MERHPFPPFVPDDPKILIMGTFPPQPKRWKMEFYYPNYTNDFWKMCGLIFFNDPTRFYNTAEKTFRLDDIKEFLRSRHIAMSDTGREVVRLRDNASDKYLEIVKTIDIADWLDRYPTLTVLITTGEKAAGIIADLTGTQAPALGAHTDFEWNGRTVSHWRMPSTSRAYPLALEKKADYYRRALL